MCVEKLTWQSDWTDRLAFISGLCRISAYAHDDLSCEINQGISRRELIYLVKQLCCFLLGYLALMGRADLRRLLKTPSNSEMFLLSYFVKKKKVTLTDFHHFKKLLLKPKQLGPKPISKSSANSGKLQYPRMSSVTTILPISSAIRKQIITVKPL